MSKQGLVYDWLTRNRISWRVYHQGISLFMMMGDWHLRVLKDRYFCSYDDFQSDLGSDAPFPQVVFVEPHYTDAPH